MKKFALLTILVLLAGCTNSPVDNAIQKEVAIDEKEAINESTNLDRKKEEVLISDENDEDDKDNLDTEEDGIEGWQVYEKEEKNIKISFHKDWWFKRSATIEKTEGYWLFVGFAPTYDVLTKERPFPVELFAVKTDNYKDISTPEDVVIKEVGDKTYFFRSSDIDKYISTINKMKDTFVYIDEVNPE